MAHAPFHHPAATRRQGGFSLFGLLFFGTLLAVLGIVTAQVVPTLIEFQAAKKAIEKAKTESSPPAIRAAFDRSATIDNIPSLTGKDLVIVKGPKDNHIVSFAYNREIHLAGPGYLLLKYTATAQ